MQRCTIQILHWWHGRFSTGGASFQFLNTSTKYWQYLHLLCFPVGTNSCKLTSCPSVYNCWILVFMCSNTSCDKGNIVSVLPCRIRLLTNSIKICLWVGIVSLSTSTWICCLFVQYIRIDSWNIKETQSVVDNLQELGAADNNGTKKEV